MGKLFGRCRILAENEGFCKTVPVQHALVRSSGTAAHRVECAWKFPHLPENLWKALPCENKTSFPQVQVETVESQREYISSFPHRWEIRRKTSCSPEHLPRFPRKQVTFPAAECPAGENRRTGQNQPESGAQFLHKLWVSFENSMDCVCSAGFSANQIAISIFYSQDRKSNSPNLKDKRYNKIVAIFRFTFRSRIELCRNPDRFS